MDTNEKNLKKLERLLSLMDEDSLTKEDFVKAFENVVQFVLKIQKQNEAEVEAMKLLNGKMMQKLEGMNVESMREMKEKITDMCEPMMTRMQKEHERMMGTMDKKMSEMRDGKDADEEKIVQNVLNQIKLPEQKKVILDGPKEIRDKLESLKGEDRLDKEAIRGLEDEIKGLKAAIAAVPRGRGGMRKVPIVRAINLSDQVDGIVTTFNLPRDTVQILGVFSTQFPVNFNANVDWTFAGQTLTLTSQVGVVQSGQTLWALVETLFYA